MGPEGMAHADPEMSQEPLCDYWSKVFLDEPGDEISDDNSYLQCTQIIDGTQEQYVTQSHQRHDW
eukprot:5496899-Pyramimonas_sp.AAC.1